ncbi:hypothetical protein JOC75_000389 [Metabacillus crassostreae]|uniref:hypothetical protein n=1 Tax=Metabacillus crassostreae TaxID=929098 RepID=UPI00195C9454|nr:hypothetical protein [Metabacillus crassostreae]MBM7602419.1 hypothetical protein [Metabacillus crassostreae]
MEKLTVVEWLQKKNVTENEIDFIVTFIPTITYLQKKPEKTTEAMDMFKKQFPTFCVELEVNNWEYEIVHKTIQKNIQNKISTKELLKRMSKQGLCKSFCDSLLGMS